MSYLYSKMPAASIGRSYGVPDRKLQLQSQNLPVFPQCDRVAIWPSRCAAAAGMMPGSLPGCRGPFWRGLSNRSHLATVYTHKHTRRQVVMQATLFLRKKQLDPALDHSELRQSAGLAHIHCVQFVSFFMLAPTLPDTVGQGLIAALRGSRWSKLSKYASRRSLIMPAVFRSRLKRLVCFLLCQCQVWAALIQSGCMVLQ